MTRYRSDMISKPNVSKLADKKGKPKGVKSYGIEPSWGSGPRPRGKPRRRLSNDLRLKDHKYRGGGSKLKLSDTLKAKMKATGNNAKDRILRAKKAAELRMSKRQSGRPGLRRPGRGRPRRSSPGDRRSATAKVRQITRQTMLQARKKRRTSPRRQRGVNLRVEKSRPVRRRVRRRTYRRK